MKAENIYYKHPQPVKIIPIEEKAEFVKRNKEFLLTPVEGYPTDKHINQMLYEIKNNWKELGAEYHETIEDWYNKLKDAGKE